MGDTLEIGAYLRGLGWRAVAAAALLVALAAVPAELILLRSPQYAAVAGIRMPSLPAATEPDFAGAKAGTQLAADVAGVLSLPATRRALAAEGGVTPAALKAGLSVAPSGTAQYVDVTYVDGSPSRARKVAALAGLKALATLNHERLSVAQATLAAAVEQEQVAGRLAAGDKLGTQAALEVLRSSRPVDPTAPSVVDQSKQVAANEGVHAAVDQARKQVTLLQEQAAAAPQSVTAGPAHRELPTTLLAALAIGGAAVALGLSYGLMLLTEMRSILRVRRSGRSLASEVPVRPAP